MGEGGQGRRCAAIDALAAVAAAAMLIGSHPACGQKFPEKPIRIIASAPGGTSDFTSRLIGRGLTDNLGQLAAKAPPDGYTLIVDGASLWLAPLMQKSPYDPVRDFAAVTIATRSPTVVLVHPSLPVSTTRELIALAKARPGHLNYASGGTGGASHLQTELFRIMAGVDIVNVNYKGTGPAINALLANEVQIMFANATIATPHMKSGKVRGIAVGSLQPSPLLPDLPTLSASGLPGFEGVILQGVLAPALTPPSLVHRLSAEIARVLNRPDVKERHLSVSVETVGSSPEDFAATIRADILARIVTNCPRTHGLSSRVGR